MLPPWLIPQVFANHYCLTITTKWHERTRSLAAVGFITKGHEYTRILAAECIVREGPLRAAKPFGGILCEGPIGPRRVAKALLRLYLPLRDTKRHEGFAAEFLLKSQAYLRLFQMA